MQQLELRTCDVYICNMQSFWYTDLKPISFMLFVVLFE